jgi:hypothetical protein
MVDEMAKSPEDKEFVTVTEFARRNGMSPLTVDHLWERGSCRIS